MLKIRSSDACMIGTLSLVLLTVCTLYFFTIANELTIGGHVSKRRHITTCYPFRLTVTWSCRRNSGAVLGLGACCHIRCIASHFFAHLWLACRPWVVSSHSACTGIACATRCDNLARWELYRGPDSWKDLAGYIGCCGVSQPYQWITPD